MAENECWKQRQNNGKGKSGKKNGTVNVKTTELG